MNPFSLAVLGALMLSNAVCANETGEVWRALFDGKALGKWKAADFGAANKISVKEGDLVVRMGEPMAGITWDGEPPMRMNYEIELEAKRTEGEDFFCGLTFPVGTNACTFIVGGWGGTVVGLSSIDGYDASENATTRMMEFEKNRWYRIRVRVTKGRIEAWINDKQMVDQETSGHRISVRMEVDPCVPLGVATWNTGAALRKIRWRSFAVGKPKS